MEKKQFNTKHRAKPVDDKADKAIQKIADKKSCSYLEAKHIYFEALAVKEAPEKESRKILSVEEAKLGVTMVITSDECKNMGIDPKITTRDAIFQIREKLGLPGKRVKA